MVSFSLDRLDQLDSGVGKEDGIVRCEVFGWVDASLESAITRSVLRLRCGFAFWQDFVQDRVYRVLELAKKERARFN